jgi:thiol-disulfide isomerase/thioredoxin
MASKNKNKKQKRADYVAPARKNAATAKAGVASPSGSTGREPVSVHPPGGKPRAATTSKAYTAPKGRETVATTREGSPRVSSTAQWAILGAVAFVVIGGFLFFSFRDAIEGGGSGVTTAQEWDLPAYYDSDDDGRVRLADFAGTPTVVNFWAGWCTSCDAEIPDFKDVAEELAGEVDFVFVHSNENESGRDMANRHDLEEFAVAKDIKGTRRNALFRSLGGGTSMPGTAFYDANGNLVETVLSPMNTASLRAALARNGLIDA